MDTEKSFRLAQSLSEYPGMADKVKEQSFQQASAYFLMDIALSLRNINQAILTLDLNQNDCG